LIVISKLMKKKITIYALHLSLCAGFILIPYIFSSTGRLFHMPCLSGNGHDPTFFAIYFALLAFFYVNYYVFIPRFYFHKKRVLYCSILVVALLFFLWISNIFDSPLNETFRQRPSSQSTFDPSLPPQPEASPNKRFPMATGHDRGRLLHKPAPYDHTVLVFIIGIISSLLLSINKRLHLTENDRIQAELALLKTQINPHFLFNTLNSIYSLAIRKDDKTADAIVQLTELMRYIMNNADDNLLDLSQEITYINNYIALQQSRLGDTVIISYLVNGDPLGKQITPLILISFIENAFKHGVNPEENSEIDILIDIEDDKMQLFVYNRKVNSVRDEWGIGMKNALERLELLYPEKHQIEIQDNRESYAVKLTLHL